MKLVLSSNGFCTPAIVAKVVELAGKPQDQINVAVINEAYAVERGDHGWVLDDLSRVKDHFGGRMELVNLLALDVTEVKARLDTADVIFVVGGHTDYLMSVCNKTGFSTLLPDLLQDKVYVGSSAGSMIIGKRVSTAAYERIYGEEGDFGVSSYLEFVDFALKPHLGSPLFPDNRSDVLLEVTQDLEGTLYGLADDAAIIVNGDSHYIIGSEPVRIVDGEMKTA